MRTDHDLDGLQDVALGSVQRGLYVGAPPVGENPQQDVDGRPGVGVRRRRGRAVRVVGVVEVGPALQQRPRVQRRPARADARGRRFTAVLLRQRQVLRPGLAVALAAFFLPQIVSLI